MLVTVKNSKIGYRVTSSSGNKGTITALYSDFVYIKWDICEEPIFYMNSELRYYNIKYIAKHSLIKRIII